jgi:hypothetical protein
MIRDRIALALAVPLLAAAATVSAQAPTLVPVVLRSVSPPAFVSGQKVTLTLSGVNIHGATRAIFDDAAITGTPTAGTDRNQAKIEATAGPEARPGIHRVYLQTPFGTTEAVTFAIGALPEAPEKEPNDSAVSGDPVALPATFVGTLERVGTWTASDSPRKRARSWCSRCSAHRSAPGSTRS